MNGRIIGLAAITLIAVGALGVLGTWRLASAWGPDVNGDGYVNAADILTVVRAYGQAVPTEVPVREQNIDPGGSIRVHEQGTASVNVANASLPVAGTVNVGNLPVDPAGNIKVAAQVSNGKTYTLLSAYSIGAGAVVNTLLVDTNGCHAFSLFVKNVGDLPPGAVSAGGDSPDYVHGKLLASADRAEGWPMLGQTNDALQAAGSHINREVQVVPSQAFAGGTAVEPFAPFAGATITGGVVARTIDAVLYCVP